jgi:hypothetical protein
VEDLFEEAGDSPKKLVPKKRVKKKTSEPEYMEGNELKFDEDEEEVLMKIHNG